MSLQIYNTLTRRKEEFKPLNPPHVGMYVCGVTVYDQCHLGHGRALVNFDVIYRYLLSRGYQVTYVRNYTDVDDKIINRAKEEGKPWNEIAQTYIHAFDADMEALGNKKPTHEPKATDNIDEIKKIITGLIKGGAAYQAGNDIFYSVRQKKDYGKLSGKKIDELESGARIEIHEAKKDPLDFALWKGSKPGEPAWDSPWGPGRPGWHIECSAMSMRFLGETFDIHGGGRDLSFPHHENEIAQSESFSGKPFARYWIHNGFVNINAEKMSKSTGNFLTLKNLMKECHPEVLRLFILSAHYRSPLEYTEKNMQAAKQSLARWYTTMARVHDYCEKSKEGSPTEAEKSLQAKASNLTRDFEEAMDDDFNTARVIGLLFDMARDWNKVMDIQDFICISVCRGFINQIEKIHQVLGLFGSDTQVFLETKKASVLKKGLSRDEVEAKIEERKAARFSKDWKRADQIRDELLKLGIEIKDKPDGTTVWQVL
ncbi:MAG: cysteine--tRNA ligase [Deltaproteobacteria bacterium]|nr:cysteine--tRNA ligase [Deltaproteobacteria bacterium]